MEDSDLLNRFVQQGCQESFEAIVTRHSGWVFSLSMRAVRDRHLAEDVTQAVFIILAKKAPSIRPGIPLSGWLFKASRFAVSDALKRRGRMRNRENRAAEFFKATNPDGINASEMAVSDEVAAELDDAVACLNENDRQAVLLRFFEGKSLAEVGIILGISEEAAKKRVARSVDKLRKFFANRGIIAPAALLLMLLSQNSVQAAGAPAITLTLIEPSIAPKLAEGAMQLMGQAQKRLLGAIFASIIALAVAAPTLGSAVIRFVELIAQPLAPVESKSFLVSDDSPPADYSDRRTIALPGEPKFAGLYIAYKNEILWRSDEFTGPAPRPFALKGAADRNAPYAVGVDHAGKYFIRQLDQQILQAPLLRQARFDYDQGPREQAQRVASMLQLIEAPPGGSSILPGHAGGSSDDRQFESPSEKQRLADKEFQPPAEWELMMNSEMRDGSMFVEQLKTQSPFAPDLPDGIINMAPESGLVPEPTSAGLVALASLGLLIRRRRST